MTLEQKFERAVWSALEKSREHGYYPTRFEGKMNRVRAVDYAKELVTSGEIQSGLWHLKKMNRLDLSVEYLVTKEEFAELFSQEEIDAAEWRLEQVRKGKQEK